MQFRTKLQSIVALSSTEAEFIGMSSAVRELSFVRNVFEFLGEKLNLPLKVFNDNQAALRIATSTGSVGRTKHIQLKQFHVQDMVKKGDFIALLQN